MLTNSAVDPTPTTTGFRPSYWEETTFLRSPDVVVVGAGLTGLQTALNVKRDNPKRDVLVMERSPIPRGASTRNAGFACFGGPTELLADLDAYGHEATVATVRARYDGIRALESNFARRGIDWQKLGGYEIIDAPDTQETVRDRLPELNRLLAEVTGLPVTWAECAPLNGLYTLHNPLEGQLHPGKLVELLVEDCRRLGVRLLFGASVLEVGGKKIVLDNYGELSAGEVIVTVNAFARRLLPEEFSEVIRPVRNQVLLSRRLAKLPLAGCYHYHEGYVYFRNVGEERILIGGGRHLAGERSETDIFAENAGVQQRLIDLLNRWLPQTTFTAADFPHRWSGIIAQGDGKTPVLRRTTDGVLVAGRLAGMGVALSAALARKAADLVE